MSKYVGLYPGGGGVNIAGKIVEVSCQNVGGAEAARMKGRVLPGKARKAELDQGEHLAMIRI